ncbi:MAG: chemotaxis protein CheW [Gammaproteobacteria bacterium]
MSTALHKLDPIMLLRELEARSRHHAMGLPMQLEIRNTWSGVGFRMGNVLLVTEMGMVSEILSIPEYTRIPGAQPWVKGLANVRGTLIPILDMRVLLNAGQVKQEKRTRMLIIKDGDAVAGFMVDEVYGMRHFFATDKQDDMPSAEEFVKPYILGSYKQEDDVWGLFDMNKISSSTAFHQVAARTV